MIASRDMGQYHPSLFKYQVKAFQQYSTYIVRFLRFAALTANLSYPYQAVTLGHPEPPRRVALLSALVEEG